MTAAIFCGDCKIAVARMPAAESLDSDLPDFIARWLLTTRDELVAHGREFHGGQEFPKILRAEIEP